MGKVMNDPFVGTLTFARIYSGVLEAGSNVYNSVKGKNERVGRMLQMHANNREEVKSAVAGDIVALCGLKDTTTGETLCFKESAVILEKMGEALVRLAGEDPSFRFSRDDDSGQTIIEG